MKQIIVQGLAQAYQNLAHMLAEFLPRFLVMLVIVLVGLLAAYVLKTALRAILHVTKLDRLSEEAGGLRLLCMGGRPSVTEGLGGFLFFVGLGGVFLFWISVFWVGGGGG